MVQRCHAQGRPFTKAEQRRVTSHVLEPLAHVLNDPGPYPNAAGLDKTEYIAALNHAGVASQSLRLVPVRVTPETPWIVSPEDYNALIWRKVVSRHQKERLLIAKLTDTMRGSLRVADAKELADVWLLLTSKMMDRPFAFMKGVSSDPPYPGWLLERLIEYTFMVTLFEKSRHLEARLERFERIWPFLLKAPPLGHHRGSHWEMLALC
jgi:hypothetical protein